MKRTTLLLAALLAVTALSAQETKGAYPVNQSTSPPVNQTRAVVVGISDYQHNAVTDLRYAHRDAEAFAEWLHSPAGGSVPYENITLLVNEQATAGKVWAALEGLTESCRDGDLALLYFSGHGDIEKVTMRQNGFLLCWDSPANGYPAGGTLALGLLRDIVETLGERNRSRVVLVTDACHAGKLAGAATNGTRTTNAALAQMFAREVKIMSCQENEYALEGEQWGDGRGLFSFHLLNGLSGTADNNADGTISLRELSRYLEDHVTTDADPHPQTPVVRGDLNFPLARVDAAFLAEWQKNKSANRQGIKRTDMRGFLTGPDSLLYRAFETALNRRDFLEPEGDCAEFYYRLLIERPALRQMQGLMRRNYAAAIMDEIQQALNALLDNDPYEANAWYFNPAKYAEYPRYLQRSMELLGENHYMYHALLAKKYFFEGYNLTKNLGNFDNDPLRRDSFVQAAKVKFLEAIEADPEAAYPYHAVGELYHYRNPPRTDSLEWWCSRAADLSPNWLAPYLLISYEYGASLIELEPAETWLRKALAQHPKSYLTLERLSWLKQWQGEADASIAISKEMIALKPDIFNAYSTLAVTLSGMKGEYLESEKYCLKSLAINPDQGWWAQTVLLKNYLRTRRAALAAETGINRLNNNTTYSSLDKGGIVSIVLSSLVQLGQYDQATYWAETATAGQWGDPSIKTHIAMELGRMYLLQGNPEKAERMLLDALTMDVSPNESWPVIFALLGDIQALAGRPAEAEAYFIKGVTTPGFLWHFFRDEAMFRYGRFLLGQNRPAEAEAQFREIAKILPKSYYHGYGMALLAATRKNSAEALGWLEKSLDNFWPDEKAIREEPLFKKLRKTKRFRDLMAKHFPAGAK